MQPLFGAMAEGDVVCRAEKVAIATCRQVGQTASQDVRMRYRRRILKPGLDHTDLYASSEQSGHRAIQGTATTALSL